MRKLILGLLGATGLAFASAAGATTSITPTEMIKASDEGGIMTFTTPGPDADGVITASFGHSGILAGDFIDYFLFTIDDDGIGSGSLSTSSSFINGLLVNSTNLDITGVFVNNILADLVLKDKDGNPCGTVRSTTCGIFETWAIQGVNIVSGIQNEIRVVGVSRGNGAFGGDATFVPSAVPEPATWGMMLLGFGAIGFSMRRRRRTAGLLQIA